VGAGSICHQILPALTSLLIMLAGWYQPGLCENAA